MAVQYPHLNPNHGGTVLGMVHGNARHPQPNYTTGTKKASMAPRPGLALISPAPPPQIPGSAPVLHLCPLELVFALAVIVPSFSIGGPAGRIRAAKEFNPARENNSGRKINYTTILRSPIGEHKYWYRPKDLWKSLFSFVCLLDFSILY